MKVLLVTLFMMMTSSSWAAVWNSNQHWDASWQRAYSNWIATQVGPRFFKDHQQRVYRSLKIDCADAQYALQAYFSMINGLHMAVNGGNITNQTTRFDHIGDQHSRLAAFIRYLSGALGTEALAHRDTYPVGLRDIKSGDIFMYKIGTNGNYTRHTYIIKNINVDGTFDVMYSTQARRDKGLPLTRNSSYVFKKAPLNGGVDRNHWGFRRAKLSSQAGVSQENLSVSNFEQYDIARRLGRRGFFTEVARLNKTIDESPNRLADRQFKNTCHVVQDRVQAVQAGVDRNNALGGRCMDFGDYDAYSTPSRDSGIKDDYLNYFEGVQAVNQSQLNRSNLALYQAVFSRSPNQSQRQQLIRACGVNTQIGAIDLASFKISLFAGRVSYHPNDNIYRRWGIERGSKTRCKEFYGYPE